MKNLAYIICAVVVSVLLTAAFLGFDWGASKAQSEARNAGAVAMQALSYSQDAHEHLGTPFTQGELSVQSFDLNPIGTSKLQVSFMVTGPKSTGKVSCALAKDRGEPYWQLVTGTFFPASGPPVSLRRPSALGTPAGRPR